MSALQATVTQAAPEEEERDGILPEGAEGASEEADFEARARTMGWKDKHEFDRPPERWVDAKTFVERGETIMPVLKQNYRQLEEKFGSVSTELRRSQAETEALRTAVDHLREMSHTAEQRAFERAKREYERERRQLEAARDAAAQTADVATVRAASAELEALRPPEAPAPFEVKVAERPRATPAQSAPGADPAETAAVEAFARAEAKWFGGDPEARDFAVARYGALQREKPELSYEARLAEVKRGVMKRFPEHFDAPASQRPAAVSTPGAAPPGRPRSRGWTWDDIPAADRATAEKTIAEVNKGNKGKPYTKEEYVAMYFKGQEKG